MLSIFIKYLCSLYFLLNLLVLQRFDFCAEHMAFTNFRPNPNRNQISGPGHLKKLSLLRKACDLIKNFPEYYDVVVNVARKTDARHWADLFSAAGISTTYVSLSVFGLCFL